MDGIKVIDDVLSKADFQALHDVMYNSTFPWYYTQYKVKPYNSNDHDDQFNSQLGHGFYSKGLPTSDYFNIVEPILNYLKPECIIRIKANLTLATQEIAKHALHKDFNYNESLTAIFYVNTNNGYTYFEGTEETIPSKENRLVIFPSYLIHAGTTCSDTKNRCVININYFINK